MNYILGKWYISKNKNFDDFLKFTHVPWYQRKIAEHCGFENEKIKCVCSKEAWDKFNVQEYPILDMPKDLNITEYSVNNGKS